MVAGLKEINAVFAKQINESVFLGYSSRPRFAGQIFQRFRFTQPCMRIAANGFDQFEDPQRRLTVGFDPKCQIFAEFTLKHAFHAVVLISPRDPGSARWLIAAWIPARLPLPGLFPERC